MRFRARPFVLCFAAAVSASAQEWPHPGNDAGGTKFSPLRQINRANIGNVREAWRFDTGDVSDGKQLPSRSTFESTPLFLDGVLYVTSAFGRVIALDGDTGRQLWAFDPRIDKSIRRNLFVNRGAAAWRDPQTRALRILLGDIQGRLWSLDANTGRPDPAFGAKGFVDLRPGMADEFPQAQYGLTSPVAVCGDTLVAGALVTDSAPQGPSGDIRGFDARTGKQLWRFHTVPRGSSGSAIADPAAAATWPSLQSREQRGGANAWSLLSVDTARRLVFVPLTSPSYDFYGGDREGANLYGNSLVALDCSTGAKRWHYQTVHHDIWDYDLPAQPVLLTVRRDDADVPAVAVVTKMGFTFVLHRETGAALFPVEEKPFPTAGGVPGEKPFATQPVPVKPPPFARQSMRSDEITRVSPESREDCLEIVEGAKLDVGLYEPLTEQPRVLFPGLNGGANWGGASFDPASGLLFVNSMDVGGLFRLVKRDQAGAAIPYALRAKKYEFFWDFKGYPCQVPPWGTLTAIDLNSGDFRWQVPLGEFEELKKRGVPKTGTPNIGGSIVTAGGLVFIAATNDRKFRAFDKSTGKELWVADLPASGFATPMTYIGKKTGKQFVVIAAGGGNKYDQKFSGDLLAFAVGGPAAGRTPATISQATSGGGAAAAARLDYQSPPEKLPIAVAPQPIAFSHRAHSEQAKLGCLDCHAGALTAERASLPSTKKCLACHVSIKANSPEVAKLKKPGNPEWVRVYRVPDFVFFSHQEHARVTGGCATCHGPVAKRDVLLKEVSTSMNTCMACHRREKASLDCALCHQLGH